MKSVFRSILVCCFIFATGWGYAFVGGAHGGFSGGYHGGGYSGYVSSHSSEQSTQLKRSPEQIFYLRIIEFCVIISCMVLYFCLESWLPTTRLGKRYRQKKYLKLCKHTKTKPKRFYPPEKIKQAISTLKHQAMEDIKKVNFLSELSHDQLTEKALKSFASLQDAWSKRNETQVLRACNNPKYSHKLSNQIHQMKRFGVYNFLAETIIKECHLVKFYKSKKTQVFVLRFIIKGTQLDEYTDKKYRVNPGFFNPREFNCVVDVVANNGPFKIYQINIDQHPDDYVMKKFKGLWLSVY
jgi:hypothetical protein